MTTPLPVTEEDKVRAWAVFYERASEFSSIPIVLPDPGSTWDLIILESLRRVLVADRAHCAKEMANV